MIQFVAASSGLGCALEGSSTLQGTPGSACCLLPLPVGWLLGLVIKKAVTERSYGGDWEDGAVRSPVRGGAN